MPRLSTAIDRANAILRAHDTPFRLREGHGSRWLSIYENCPAACSKTPRSVLIKGSTTFLPGSSTRPAASAQPPLHPPGPKSAKPWWPSNGARG